MGDYYDSQTGYWYKTEDIEALQNKLPKNWEDTNWGKTVGAFVVANELCKALTGEPAHFTPED
ncbi:hypothetical protein ACTMTF_47445 [Nonomuraea sp. ZG12]|uniref:hypothetical protein n=1 Tax=Nonomuraea sp. ZG12 TaxID=3452207 RepID=UPI003F88A819